MKIYVCGKVTGLPREQVVIKFQESVKKLIEAGVTIQDIVNPTELVPEDAVWSVAMGICFDALDECGAVYIQPDWRDSLGARHELTKSIQERRMLFFENIDTDLKGFVDSLQHQKQKCFSRVRDF